MNSKLSTAITALFLNQEYTLVMKDELESVGYDKSSAKSIYEFSLRLFGKSLSQVVNLPPEVENKRNRGDLGSLVEKYFFKHIPASNKGPDFPLAELELKTTGVVRISSNKFKAKERLVLGMINFEKIVQEKWNDASVILKCRKMLILFYQFEKDVPVIDRIFVIPSMLYELPEADLPIIRKDWELIQKKVLDGKAHELSEGDTFYLGACRKGAGGEGEPLRSQPFSPIGAKSRAFSFKQNYLNFLIEGHGFVENKLATTPDISIDFATRQRFSSFEGMSVSQISEEFNFQKRGKNHKNFHRELAVKILTKNHGAIPELRKAGIEMKTIRVKKSGMPREAMSFPGFDFMQLLDESWEDSSFFEKIESKFLFVVFKEDSNGVEKFVFARYWNMPYEDRLEAQRVWEETKRRVSIDATNLPSSKESLVAHVRPKGRDGNDKAITPQGTMHLKQCFWLNAKYIQKILDTI